jgi:hypothetical protein
LPQVFGICVTTLKTPSAQKSQRKNHVRIAVLFSSLGNITSIALVHAIRRRIENERDRANEKQNRLGGKG